MEDRYAKNHQRWFDILAYQLAPGHTLKSTGERFSLTSERVRQICYKAHSLLNLAERIQKIKEIHGDSVLDYPIEALNLDTRTNNGLLTVDIKTIGDVISKSREYFLALKNLGPSSLRNLQSGLSRYGMSISPSEKKCPHCGRRLP